jgi:transposase
MPSLQCFMSNGRKYWRVVECRRVAGKPRPVPVCYLGTIENILSHFTSTKESSEEQWRVQSYEHGNIASLLAIAQQLDVISTIDKHIPKDSSRSSVGECLLLAALNRAIHPTSKRGWAEWADETSISQFFPHIKIEAMTSQHFWAQMNKVSEMDLEDIEKELTQKIVDIYNVRLDTLFYDTTNYFTFIASTNTRCALPQRGKNKQRRIDLRQFSLALLVSRDGHIPLFSHTYEGNKVDVTEFSDSFTQIRNRIHDFVSDPDKITLVYDKGNNSRNNQHKVDRSGFGYITSLPCCHHSDLQSLPVNTYDKLICPGDLNGTRYIRLKKNIWGAERTIILFVSENLKEGQIRGLDQHVQKSFEKLNEWKESLKKKNSGPRSKASLQRKIDSLVQAQYLKDILHISYNSRKKGADRLSWTVDFEEKLRVEGEVFGKRLLISNRHDWSTEEIIKGYHGQSGVEETFKESKNDEHFAIRPQFHWTDHKIKVHVFICLLSLMLGGILELCSRRFGRTECLSKLMDRLARIRLALIISSHGKKKKDQKVSWVLENADEKLLDFYHSLVPQKAPFVYTHSFSKKIPQKVV